MTKIEGWETRLSLFLLASARGQFIWGVSDCCQFAAGAIAAISGIHPAPELMHITEGEAVTIMNSFPTLEDLARHFCIRAGLSEVEGLPMRGDVCIADGPPKAMGIFDGRQILCRTNVGIVPISTKRMIASWRVPCLL